MNVRTLMTALAVTAAFAGIPAPAVHGATAAPAVVVHPGFVIRAEDRFDPAIQRLMAEYSLRSLPLERGQLFYLYPIGITPRLEGMQIRYLETLLDKQAALADPAPETADEGDPEKE